ncbi:MAG: hypothetical protein BJ554DRAFT_1857, partial [Olpidium bornovanus]
MRSALLFCLAAVVATAVAAPSPCGPDCSSSPEVLPDDPPAAAAACYAGPEVDAERWAHARMGNHRAGEELADRPPLRTAAGLEVRFDGPGDAVLGDFAHTGCRNGATLRKLEVWGGDDDDAAGVRLTFRDGEEFAAGVPRGCYTSRDFAEGERVTLHRQSRDGRRAAFAAVPAADPAFRLGGDIGPYDVHPRFDLPLPHAGLICGVSGTDGPGGLAALDFHFAPRAEFSHIVIDRSSFTPDQVTVTDHQPDINTINLEREPVPAERSLHTRAYTYKVDSGLGYWAETSVRVTDPPEGHPGEGAAPFDVDYRTFQGTREFALEAPPETIKFEIPPRSECVVRVKERVANAFHARWTGTETYYFEDGRTYSIKTGGTLRGFDVMARKTAEDCFPVGLVHSWHEKSHDWEEQCVAAKCSKDGDCCGDLECIGGRCKSGVLIPPAEPPLELVHPGHVHTWLRQCAGARCKADSDCCGDMVCNKSAKTCVSPFLPYHLPPLVPEPEVPIYHEEVVEEEEEEEEDAVPPTSLTTTMMPSPRSRRVADPRPLTTTMPSPRSRRVADPKPLATTMPSPRSLRAASPRSLATSMKPRPRSRCAADPRPLTTTMPTPRSLRAASPRSLTTGMKPRPKRRRVADPRPLTTTMPSPRSRRAADPRSLPTTMPSPRSLRAARPRSLATGMKPRPRRRRVADPRPLTTTMPSPRSLRAASPRSLATSMKPRPRSRRAADPRSLTMKLSPRSHRAASPRFLTTSTKPSRRSRRAADPRSLTVTMPSPRSLRAARQRSLTTVMKPSPRSLRAASP